MANSADSAISMATAGRGVFLAPEISLCWRPTINYSVLPDSKNRFELYVIRRKNSEGEATVDNFVRILFDVVGRLLGKDSLARC